MIFLLEFHGLRTVEKIIFSSYQRPDAEYAKKGHSNLYSVDINSLELTRTRRPRDGTEYSSEFISRWVQNCI